MADLAPSPADLATLEEVQAYVADGSDGGRGQLQRLLTAVSRAIARYLSRDIQKRTYAESRDGPGRATLYLRQAPVLEVASVLVDGLAVPARVTPRDGGWVLAVPGDPDGLAAVVRDGQVWPKGIQNIVINYDAGYVTPGQAALDASGATTVTLPEDLSHACVQWVGHLAKEPKRLGEVSKELGSGSTVTFSQERIPPKVKALLDPWQKVLVP